MAYSNGALPIWTGADPGKFRKWVWMDLRLNCEPRLKVGEIKDGADFPVCYQLSTLDTRPCTLIYLVNT